MTKNSFVAEVTFKPQSHKMVKHAQTIRRQKPTNCLSVFDHFVELALKVLKNNAKNTLVNFNQKQKTQAPKFGCNDRSITASLPQTLNDENDFSLPSISLSEKKTIP